MALLDLPSLNATDRAGFVAALDGVYEHSPWVAEDAFERRPPGGFVHAAALKRALVEAVRAAPRERQLALIRAHPELAGKAAMAETPTHTPADPLAHPLNDQLTEASRNEQTRAGLQHCSAAEFARLQQLNADYGARFGWPFILAVRGPRGTGLNRAQIIDTFARRLENDAEFEFAECLRQIHRIAELRLSERMDGRMKDRTRDPVAHPSGATPSLGEQIWDWAEQLAEHSDPGFAERGQLTLTYLSTAHQAATQQLHAWMLACGFDSVHVDAVGNLVAVYQGSDPQAPRLLTGSHFDTVRNGGKYDGRLGILVPMAAVQALHRANRRLPFGIELVAFAEEEGQRWNATFLASGALIGEFDPDWLDQRDAEGVTMRAAMQSAGLPATLEAIAACRRDPARYRGFVEVHIEQGPVLDALDLPLGVVTSINGSLRLLGEVIGRASHAGTTPMGQRRDAAAAVAELLLFVEQRAAAVPDVVGTVGLLEVPAGSINVVPGRCRFSLDLRATTDAARDALRDDVVAELERIVDRRGLRCTLEPTMDVAAAPCDPAWQARWAAAVAGLGLTVHRMPSGAGHDAMLLHRVMPQAMLFVRGGNAGISHNPLETITADDAELCVLAFQSLLEGLASESAQDSTHGVSPDSTKDSMPDAMHAAAPRSANAASNKASNAVSQGGMASGMAGEAAHHTPAGERS